MGAITLLAVIDNCPGMGLTTVKSRGSIISMVSSGVIPGRKMMAELSRGVSTSRKESKRRKSDRYRQQQ